MTLCILFLIAVSACDIELPAGSLRWWDRLAGLGVVVCLALLVACALGAV